VDDVITTDSVGREIRGLSPGHLADFLRIGELLCRYGPQEVGMPHVRPLGDKLWEMRLRDGWDCEGDLFHDQRPPNCSAACL
jgi:hypothetical protein